MVKRMTTIKMLELRLYQYIFFLVKGCNDVNPKLFTIYFTMMNYFIYAPLCIMIFSL